jgi:hypothetical protein
MLSFGVIIYFMLSFDVIIFWCYHLMLSLGVIIWCYHLFYVIIWCYHFSQFANVITFVLSFFLVQDGCYHLCYHLMLLFPPFFSFFLKTWHTLSFQQTLCWNVRTCVWPLFANITPQAILILYFWSVFRINAGKKVIASSSIWSFSDIGYKRQVSKAFQPFFIVTHYPPLQVQNSFLNS